MRRDVPIEELEGFLARETATNSVILRLEPGDLWTWDHADEDEVA